MTQPDENKPAAAERPDGAEAAAMERLTMNYPVEVTLPPKTPEAEDD